MLALLAVSCATEAKKFNHVAHVAGPFNHMPVNNKPIVFFDPYDIQIGLDIEDNNQPFLEVSIEPYNFSEFLSPHTKGDFKGKLSISLEVQDLVILDKDFTETPTSKAVYDNDPFIKSEVNWVKDKTTYRHRVDIQTIGEFSVSGTVRFVIEPRCTLEEIPFVIFYKEGILHAVKADDGC